jgi:hypothetical protein
MAFAVWDAAGRGSGVVEASLWLRRVCWTREQEADSAGELERAEGREPGPRHAYFIHVGEDEFGVREIGDSGPGIRQDRDDGDDKVVVGGCRSGQKPFV